MVTDKQQHKCYWRF